MREFGVDARKGDGLVWVLTEDGEHDQFRTHTGRESPTAFFVGQPKAWALLEAGTQSEWVFGALELLGHEVTVVIGLPSDACVARSQGHDRQARGADILRNLARPKGNRDICRSVIAVDETSTASCLNRESSQINDRPFRIVRRRFPMQVLLPSRGHKAVLSGRPARARMGARKDRQLSLC